MTKFYFEILFDILLIGFNSWVLYKNIKKFRKSDSQLENHIRKLDRNSLNKYSIEELKLNARRRENKMILSSIIIYIVVIVFLITFFHSTF